MGSNMDDTSLRRRLLNWAMTAARLYEISRPIYSKHSVLEREYSMFFTLSEVKNMYNSEVAMPQTKYIK